MTFSVTLDKQLSTTDDPDLVNTPVRLLVAVTSVTDFDDFGIFTFAINQVTGDPEYSHVATPDDLRDYNFDVAGGKDFVRKAAIDLVFERAVIAETAIEEIEGRIQQLVDDQQALGDFGTVTTVTISAT